MNFEKTKVFYDEIKNYIVDGVASSFHITDVEEAPLCVEYGKGPRVYDIDGNEYIDYVLGLGPMILGHADEKTDKAVIEQLSRGTHFSAPTPQLKELAKRMCEIIPCAERIMFESTGSEADMVAFRLARAYTQKEKIIKFEGHYHGWADEQNITFKTSTVAELGPKNNPNKIYNVLGQRSATADDIVLAPWNDLETLEEIIKANEGEIAGMIMEPFMCDEGPIPPKEGYLKGVRDLCDKYGIVLIFDEIITGFRLALGGAQEKYGVTPDIGLFAKALAGGYPMSMICGKKEIMECGVKVSGCFNGNPVASAAGIVVADELSKPGVYENFQKLGDMLCDGFKELCKKYGVKGYAEAHGAIALILFGKEDNFEDIRDYIENGDVDFYNQFFAKAKEYGVRLTYRRGRIFLSTKHTVNDIKLTLEAFDKALKDMTI